MLLLHVREQMRLYSSDHPHQVAGLNTAQEVQQALAAVRIGREIALEVAGATNPAGQKDQYPETQNEGERELAKWHRSIENVF